DLLPHRATLEDDEVRDAAHAVANGGAGVVVDVHLDDLQLPRVLARELLDNGRDGSTRCAPRRPEVDEHGRAAWQHFLLERVVGDGENVRHRRRVAPRVERGKSVSPQRSLTSSSTPKFRARWKTASGASTP